MLTSQSLKNISAYSQLGLIIAASVLIGFFGGWWLDGKIGTKPALAIIGAFIGMAGGFLNLVRVLNQLQSQDNNDKKERSDGSED